MDYRIPGEDASIKLHVVYEGALEGDPFQDDGVQRCRVVHDISDDDYLVVYEGAFEGKGGMYLRAQELENTLKMAAIRIAHKPNAQFRGRLILQVDTRPLSP